MSRPTLVSVQDLVNQGVLEVSDGYRTKVSEHGRPGYRIVRVADVLDGEVRLTGSDFVSGDYRKQIGSKISQAGDVLLTTKGTVGRVAMMPYTTEPVVYSPQLCFFRVIDETVINRRYLRYWFSSPDFSAQAAYRMNNTDMAAYINLADIRSLKLELPSILKQDAIAEMLGVFDDKIAANTRLVSIADALAGSLTRSALDVTRRVELKDIALVTMGSSPPGTSYNEVCEGIVFYQGVSDFGMRFPINRIWTTEPVRMANAGDSLLSVRAPVGKLNLSAERTCIGRGLASVRSTAATPMTLFHLLRDAPEAWAPYEAEGTIFGSINRGQLESLGLPMVAEDLAKGLEQRLGALEASIASCLNEIDELAALRNALLPALMSGKIRVEDVEQRAGEVA